VLSVSLGARDGLLPRWPRNVYPRIIIDISIDIMIVVVATAVVVIVVVAAAAAAAAVPTLSLLACCLLACTRGR